MDSAAKILRYGTVEIYTGEKLGEGAYGRVCKAKYGQLPCAVKLLHGHLLNSEVFTKKFEEECEFLSTIRHPNIVQYLDTIKIPNSTNLALLMELMDESLTKFLERSNGPLPYYSQVNICYDVALALAYLHDKGIIHRDLSGNNVLLIGEGSRAKVTDFGMSKLVDMNPHATAKTLTKVPGMSVYMPPEALVDKPSYSNKLDCFSHGVLTIHIITRNFPDPGDAYKYVDDIKHPIGRMIVQFPENVRRKKDIDLIKPDHPLRPIALQCIKDREKERPSSDELCGKLASLKKGERYTCSKDQSSNQMKELQLDLIKKEQEIQSQKEELIKLPEAMKEAIKMKDEEINGKNQQMKELQLDLIKKEQEIQSQKEELIKLQEAMKEAIKMIDEEKNQQMKELQLDLIKKEQESRSQKEELIKLQEAIKEAIKMKDEEINEKNQIIQKQARMDQYGMPYHDDSPIASFTMHATSMLKTQRTPKYEYDDDATIELNARDFQPNPGLNLVEETAGSSLYGQNLEVGSLVQIESKDKLIFGTIKWIGHTTAGIELVC